VAELTVQYSQITDCGAMLWTPLLFRKRISGRVVTVAGEEERSKGERVTGGGSRKWEGDSSWFATTSLTHTVTGIQSSIQLSTPEHAEQRQH